MIGYTKMLCSYFNLIKRKYFYTENVYFVSINASNAQNSNNITNTKHMYQ